MSKASTDAMEALHGQLADTLATAVRDGVKVAGGEGVVTVTCPASVLSVARQFLKDNHIEGDMTDGNGSDLAKAMDEMNQMPFDGEIPPEYTN